MTTVSIKINVGNPPRPQIASRISLQIILLKKQIEEHYQSTSKQIQKYRLPTLLFSMPASLKHITLPQGLQQQLLKDMFSEQTLQKDGKFYRMFELKEPQLQAVLGKVQKVFKKLTTYNNNISLNVHTEGFSNLVQRLKTESLDLVSAIFENAKVEGLISLEQDFVKIIGQIIGKISPGFEESPIISGLQLFQGAQLQLEFENPSNVKKKTKQQLIQGAFGSFQNFNENDPDHAQGHKIVTQLFASKQYLDFYFHLGQLGYVHLQVQAKFLGMLWIIKQ